MEERPSRNKKVVRFAKQNERKEPRKGFEQGVYQEGSKQKKEEAY